MRVYMQIYHKLENYLLVEYNVNHIQGILGIAEIADAEYKRYMNFHGLNSEVFRYALAIRK